MALSVVDEGSQTATVGTEHQLSSSQTASGVYLLEVDLVNLANGDTVEIYVKAKVRSSGAQQLAFHASYSHAQGKISVYSPPIASAYSIGFFLKQTAGTGRAFPWLVATL